MDSESNSLYAQSSWCSAFWLKGGDKAGHT